MKCPVCKDTNLVLSERRGVEIDYCPDCRGVWLDRGELDKMMEQSRSLAPAEYADRDRSDYSRSAEYRDRPKRKKSFFEEIFD